MNIIDILSGGSPITSLEKKSESILDVFTSTINQLGDVNAQIESEAKTRQEMKAKLEDELTKLENMKGKNIAVITKIQKLFEA